MQATSDSRAPAHSVSTAPRGEGIVLTYELRKERMHEVRDVHPVASIGMVKVTLHSPARTPRDRCEFHSHRRAQYSPRRPHLQLLLDILPRPLGQHAQRVAAQIRAWLVRCSVPQGSAGMMSSVNSVWRLIEGATLTQLGRYRARLHLRIRRDDEVVPKDTERVLGGFKLEGAGWSRRRHGCSGRVGCRRARALSRLKTAAGSKRFEHPRQWDVGCSQ